MLLKKITLENFRQYNEKHEILFSTDKERNVTLVMGDNGSGKTTLSQAFLWCFYGTTPAFLKKESLFSKKIEDEMFDGWNRKTVVSIEMEHNDKNYEVTRSKSFVKQGTELKEIGNSFFIKCNYYDENGNKNFLEGKELENFINEILPEGLSQYFFLSGEKIDDMSFEIKSGKSKAFANAVNTLLDLDYYKTTIKHLKNIAKEYNTSGVEGFDDNLNELNCKIESDEHNIVTFDKNLSEQGKKFDYFSDKIAELKQELQNTESSKDLENERQRLQTKLEKKKQDSFYEIESGISDFVRKAACYFAQKSMQKSLETLRETSEIEENDIPERLHADLIDWIEKKETCVCGEPIKKGDKHFDILEKWRHIVPPESIGTLIKAIRNTTNQKILYGKDLYTSLKDRRNRIYQYSSDAEDLDAKIEEISEKISNATDTSGIERQLKQYQDDRKNLQEDINQASKLIANLRVDKEQKEKEREILLLSNKEGRKVLAWKQMTEKLIDGFERKLEEDEKSKREKLTDAVKTAFKEMYGDSFTINIDNNYNITTSTSLEKSSGQGMTVIFAFLAGLLSVIKENQQKIHFTEDSEESEELKLESYPLVLDAPFSVLDTQRIAAICEVLPKVSEQIIIFIKDTDGKITKEKMQSKIGKCYHLEKIDGSEENSKIVEE